jgi:diguanylate cyclase
MQAGGVLQAGGHGDASQAVIASMRQYGIRFTASHYAVWHGYLAGDNPAVTRAIDMVLSNGKTLDESALESLYQRHFCPAQRAQQLRDLAELSLRKVEDMRTLLNEAPTIQAASGSVDALLQQMRVLVAGSQTLANQLAQSQERIGLLESFLHDATRDASTDALTGLSNRRAFDHALRHEAAHAMNAGSSLAFVLLDIDHFKMVNDHWGHPAGDEVLRQVAGTLTRTVRGGDVVARYGGEEFAVILPDTGRRGALAVAENMREAVASEPFCISGNPASPDDPGSELGLFFFDVTISAGISCYVAGEPISQWLGRADVALYCAKDAGRNRVMFGSNNQMPKAMHRAVDTQLPAPLPL